jgi:KUP system potassium uptake protein
MKSENLGESPNSTDSSLVTISNHPICDRNKITTALYVGVLGVVYGDIGTSPLYALRECFSGLHAIALTQENIFSVLSLIFWSLTIVVSIKYVLFIMRAENKQEGGILALVALAGAVNKVKSSPFISSVVLILGLFGAALLYGDGIITPAISVLSAVEGLKLVTPALEHYVVYITAGILIALFSIQYQGTARIGKLFGPVMCLWFGSLAIAGLFGIVKEPKVLLALNPYYAVNFLLSGTWHSFAILGAVFLSVTGGEALYADMGHFGRRPIQVAWFTLVMPALVINYFGQGALLLTDPKTVENPFYRLVPEILLIPAVFLAAFATIIASQSMITGVFSITRQAIQLGFLPRTKIIHTSEGEIGQIYLPVVNWWLLVSTLFLVFQFKSSGNLANAYGIAVSLTMVITTLLAGVVVRYVWNWSLLKTLVVVFFFLVIDSAFLAANIAKLFHGGVLPLIIGLVGCLSMLSWRKGRAVLSQKLYQSQAPLAEFVAKVAADNTTRIPGTAVFLSTNSGSTPAALSHTLKHNKALLSRIIIMTMMTEGVPYVSSSERIKVEDLGNGFYAVIARLGFMEGPNVPRLMRSAAKIIPDLEPSEATFYLGREMLVIGKDSSMPWWQAKLFMLLSRNAENASSYFRLSPDRVIEVGMHVGI